MYFCTNDFTDAFKRDGQPLDVAALSVLRGQSFDVHNDCWIDYRGEHIHIRGVSKPVSIERLGILGAAEEALRVWERARNGDSAFAAYYAPARR